MSDWKKQPINFINSYADSAVKTNFMNDSSCWPVSSEKLLAETQQLTDSGVWCLDTRSQMLYWSDSTYALFERELDKAPTLDDAINYYSKSDRLKISKAIENAIDDNEAWSVEAEIITESGRKKFIRTCGRPFKLDNGAYLLFGSIQDISQSHSNLLTLKQRTKSLNAILDNLVDGVITINEKGIIQGFSKPAERIFGYQADEVVGLNVKHLMPQPYRREHDQYLTNYQATGKRKIIGIGREVTALRKNGEEFPIDLAVSETKTELGTRFIGTVRDITQQKEAAKRIEFLSHHDELTGLPNRARLLEQTEVLLRSTAVTVACLNIDYFRRINSVLGEDIGDQVILSVAERVKSAVGKYAMVAKDLADRFIIACACPPCVKEDIIQSIESLVVTIREPIVVDTCINPIHITVSAGIASLSKGTNAKDALVNAESALERAKRQGRNRSCVYQDTMLANLQYDYKIETGLHEELQRLKFGQNVGFECWLQSKVNRNFEVCGAEALIRWRYQGQLIRPDEFIPLAERLGLIIDIGFWMLTKVAGLISATNLPIAINVSPKQFLEPDFPEKIIRVMRESDAPFENLIIEITENLLLHDHTQVLSVMNELNQVGIQFSIDDFGTGYSNLRRLQLLPVSELKIDKEFTQNAFHSERDRNLLDSIILMAKQMRVEIVAEGVETALQAAYLKDSGVDLQQGYYFAKPISSELWARS
ncbi:putative bifunctional diguanylate cyclase/phosphodiesterase [Idiomarina piscisalsi]|uniref:putative bifunctional diguanylate cyclase/phosphodiesterase n=1 Tax=Idiomarina piscisalsi TaxID=1096243 RepID=UPI0018E59F0C|nr:bifunctional diguanylate cyclase/phosphodiesterase [Idiomarina piscisalsi]